MDPDGKFEFDPAVLAKYPNIKPALENLKTELQKPENAKRLNNIVKMGQYGSSDAFLKLFDDNNKDVKITSMNGLSLDEDGRFKGNIGETSLKNEKAENFNYKGVIAFDEILLKALDTGDKEAYDQVVDLFGKTAEHELTHYGDLQNGVKADALLQFKKNEEGGISIDTEAGEIYEKITYGVLTGPENLPKADKVMTDIEKMKE